MARLLGYRWPPEVDDEDASQQTRAKALVARCDMSSLGSADRDGIVCIPSVRGERNLRLSSLIVHC